MGLINERSSPKAFLQAKPKNVNRLSNFLLANNKKEEPKTTTFDARQAKERIAANSPTKKKFSRMAMAMLVSKGANCEDRIITRSMRGEESGGVVDLGTNTLKQKNQKKLCR